MKEGPPVGPRYFGGVVGAQVDTPAPTIRNPTFVMYAVSTDPSLGRYRVTFDVRVGFESVSGAV